MRANGYLVEDKFTDNQSFTITAELWRKIEREAGVARLRPRMRISIAGLPKLCIMLEDDHLYEQGLLTEVRDA